MLIRRKFDLKQTVFKGRQDWPEYHCTGQEVMLDPWEEDDCAKKVAQAFSVGGVEELQLGLWIHVAAGNPFLPDGGHLVRIAEDRTTGYTYYRRLIDIERQQQWNQDRTFRVTAEQW
jgi:hypothetical protein